MLQRLATMVRDLQSTVEDVRVQCKVHGVSYALAGGCHAVTEASQMQVDKISRSTRRMDSTLRTVSGVVDYDNGNQ